MNGSKIFLFKSKFKLWVPVLPFYGFWVISFAAYYFGPFVYRGLSFGTIFYIGFVFLVFTFLYNLGLHSGGGKWRVKSYNYLLNASGILVAIGALLMLYDRQSTGSGNLDAVLNEMYNVRELYSKNTSFLTTIAVVPYSFKTVFIATLFYSVINKIKLTKIALVCLVILVVCDLANMVLSANRGMLYWYFCYFLFYLLFVRGLHPLSLISFNKRAVALMLVAGVSLSYFYFVSENRTVDSTLEYLALNSENEMRYNGFGESLSLVQLGAFEQLYSYITHGLEYTDIILGHANFLYFDPVSPFGIRVVSQIQRFYPDYMTPTSLRINEWLFLSGKSIYGWSSVFGISLAAFGIFGSIIFFGFYGYFSGVAVGRFNKTGHLAWLIVVFGIFDSMLITFDWFIRDFGLLVALICAFFLLHRFRLG